MTKDINLDPAFDLIVSSRIADWDKESVAAAVEKAVEAFLPADRQNTVVATESYGEEPFPYKIDLILRDDGGRLTVVDWKTKRAGKMDERWQLREMRSWQPRIYAAAVATKYGRDVFPLIYEVRGVTLEDSPRVATVKLVLGRSEAYNAVQYLRHVTAMRKALIERKKQPWVRNPTGCQMFGPMYPCEFEGVCWREEAPPEHDDGKVERVISHSAGQEFLRCPERYRLLRVSDKPESDEDAAAVGKVFHSAMEAIYSQLVSRDETNNKDDASK